LSWTRKAWQLYSLALFLYLFYMMWHPRHEAIDSNLFLRLDPLASLGIILTLKTLPPPLFPSILLLLPVFFLGRFFCSWICPLGTLNEAVSWCFLRNTPIQKRMALHQRERFDSFKYILFAFLIGLAVGGVLELGLFSPLSLMMRSLSIAILPSLHSLLPHLYVQTPMYTGAWLTGILFLLILLLNAIRPRFWCRSVCPMGVLLGICAKTSPFRIRRHESSCIQCGKCVTVCGGACEPNGSLRQSDCIVCLRCRDICPTGALTFGPVEQVCVTEDTPNLQRRHVLAAAFSGLLSASLLEVSMLTNKLRHDSLIRPPGAVDEEEFLARCMQCGACMRVCPNHALQPSLGLSGPQGLFSPILLPRVGYCELHCTSCGNVCPTGAIQSLTLEDRIGPERVKCGTAFFDKSRCLTWALDRHCGVCQEICPVSPKAIVTIESVVTREGAHFTLKRYGVDSARCVGCGHCENICPIQGKAGIRVSAMGESRSLHRRLLLEI